MNAELIWTVRHLGLDLSYQRKAFTSFTASPTTSSPVTLLLSCALRRQLSCPHPILPSGAPVSLSASHLSGNLPGPRLGLYPGYLFITPARYCIQIYG
ncbi:hypothetical protein BaRGS_00030608 [Batillaria attramentaria]|uniref:Uncharacterized protein n=1 Tax=Batillaria attramentaria TaxID=370345 RepID=A0ABD0JSR8_9CAEN